MPNNNALKNNALKNNALKIIVLAGGEGKRMGKGLPKVLRKVANKPMILHVLENALLLSPQHIYIVVGKHRDVIQSTIKSNIPSNIYTLVDQSPPLGTGHAVKKCLPYISNEDKVLIINGDTPLLQLNLHYMIMNNSIPSIMATRTTKPDGQGRIVKTPMLRIVEEKDATDDEKKITLVNCGVYYLQGSILHQYIPLLNTNNNQKEYYLTDIFKHMSNDEIDVFIYTVPKHLRYEIINVNTLDDLMKAEETYKTYNKLKEQ